MMSRSMLEPNYAQLATRVPRDLLREVKLHTVCENDTVMAFVERALTHELVRVGGVPKLPSAPKARRCSTKRAVGASGATTAA